MSLVGDLISSVFERRFRAALSDEASGRTVMELVRDLLSSSGEVSGETLARLIFDRYEQMGDDQKQAFFESVVNELDIDAGVVAETLHAYKAAPTRGSYRAFAHASEPKRQELIRRLNRVAGGTHLLVAMRHDLLRLVPNFPKLEPLDVDFQHLFASWFNRGFLILRPINWTSPADVLEKIIAYEAVHAIDSWADLRRRLQPLDRRCFGFFHPAIADEPLIFVEVALTKGIPNSIQDLLADGRETIDPEDADTAVFYSISNCQAGLAGISFGNSLIKQVASDLSRDLPALKNFVTLSPIPGLNKWFETTNTNAEPSENEQAFAAHYLLEAKRSDGMPTDPVARFHLGNGAMVHAVHANADISDNGMAQSNGTMVNYLYDLSQITSNHEQFVSEKTVIASSEVRVLSASFGKNA
jgi:malonyl-CoA decarboxylase